MKSSVNKKVLALFFLNIILVGIACLSYWKLSAPMVSVVMPVYNGAQNNYLHRSIPSILNQSFRDFEFIMIDDGSSDNSWQILTEYAAKDKRIKLLKNDKNRGISYSRNRGNDLARGKYIMLMDQDDDNLPDRMLKQVAFMESRPWLDLVATPSVTEMPWIAMHDEDKIKFGLFFDNVFGHPNVMMKRSFLKKNNIRYNETIKCANDYDLMIRIRDKGGRFGYMYESLFIYNGANYSATQQCPMDATQIYSRFSSYDRRKEPKLYLCSVAKMAQETPQYAKLFTPGFLKVAEYRFCQDPL